MAQQTLTDWLKSHPLPRPGLFQKGYDASSVDVLLDQVIARMDAGRQFTDLVASPTFPSAARGSAYAIDAVDDLLDNLKWGSDPRD